MYAERYAENHFVLLYLLVIFRFGKDQFRESKETVETETLNTKIIFPLS